MLAGHRLDAVAGFVTGIHLMAVRLATSVCWNGARSGLRQKANETARPFTREVTNGTTIRLAPEDVCGSGAW